MTKLSKVCYEIKPYMCPNCKALYFSNVECYCPNKEIENFVKLGESKK